MNDDDESRSDRRVELIWQKDRTAEEEAELAELNEWFVARKNALTPRPVEEAREDFAAMRLMFAEKKAARLQREVEAWRAWYRRLMDGTREYTSDDQYSDRWVPVQTHHLAPPQPGADA